ARTTTARPARDSARQHASTGLEATELTALAHTSSAHAHPAFCLHRPGIKESSPQQRTLHAERTVRKRNTRVEAPLTVREREAPVRARQGGQRHAEHQRRPG